MLPAPPSYADVVAEILFPPPAYTARPTGSAAREAAAAAPSSTQSIHAPAPYSQDDPQTPPIPLRSTERDAYDRPLQRWWEYQSQSEMQSTAAAQALFRHHPHPFAPQSYTPHNLQLARAALADIDAYGRPVRRWWDYQVQGEMATQRTTAQPQSLLSPQPQEQSRPLTPVPYSLHDPRLAQTALADVDAYGRPARRWSHQQPHTGLRPRSRMQTHANSHTPREVERSEGICGGERGRLQIQTAQRPQSLHRPITMDDRDVDLEAQSDTDTTEIEAARRLERGRVWSGSRGRYQQLPKRAKDDLQATGCIRKLNRPSKRESRLRQAMWQVLGFCAAPALLLAVLVVCVLSLTLFAVSWLLWVVGLSGPAQLEQTTFYRFIERSTETCMTGRWGLVSLLEIRK